MKDVKTKIINIDLLKSQSKKILLYALIIFCIGLSGTVFFSSLTEAKEDIEYQLKNWEIEHQKIINEKKEIENILAKKRKEECESEKKGAAEKLKVNAIAPKEFPLDDKKAAELKYKRDTMNCDF